MLKDVRRSDPHPDLVAWFSEAAPGWMDAVLPAYGGGSIANIPASIMAGFGTPAKLRELMLPAVAEDLLPADFLSDARVIVLIVIDGLGALALERLVQDGDVPGLASATHRSRLTSVFPPTTAAATTSLQYGLAPGTHGMAGYTLFLPEIDNVFNMITWRVPGAHEQMDDAPAPEEFLKDPNLFRQLERAGIETVIVSNSAFATSPLTRAQASGVRYRGHRTLAEFAHRLLREVERPGRRFIFGYWDGYDALGHTWGADSAVAGLEARLIDQALREGFLAHLHANSDDVAVLLTADHGHIPTPRDQRIDLTELPRLIGALKRRPTGEPRQLGVVFHEDKAPDLDQLNEFLGERGLAADMAAAIAAGLFGPPPHHSDLNVRTGTAMLLARGGCAFSFPGGSSGSLGGHGSLTAWEMQAPLLAWRFPGN